MMLNANIQSDMNDANSRETMIRRLLPMGIEAKPSNFGGDLRGLEIALIVDNGREALSIIVASIDVPCEVTLSGFRTVAARSIECGILQTVCSETINQAADAIQVFWENRAAFIRDFRAGRYDLS